MPGTECRCPAPGGWRPRGMDRHREAVLGAERKPRGAHLIPLLLPAPLSIPRLIAIPAETPVALAGQGHTPTAGPHPRQASRVGEGPSPRPGGSAAGVRNASPGAGSVPIPRMDMSPRGQGCLQDVTEGSSPAQEVQQPAPRGSAAPRPVLRRGEQAWRPRAPRALGQVSGWDRRRDPSG